MINAEPEEVHQHKSSTGKQPKDMSQGADVAHHGEPGANESPRGTGIPGETVVHVEKKKSKRIVIPAGMVTHVQGVLPTENQRRDMNIAYLSSVHGILKVATIALAIVIFCTALSIPLGFGYSMWVVFLAYTSMLFPMGLLALHVLFPHLLVDDLRNRTSVAMLELIFYAWHTLMWFVAIWLMINVAANNNFNYSGIYYVGKRGEAIFCIVLNIVMTGVFAAETFFKFLAWRSLTGGNQPQHTGTMHAVP